MSNCEEFSDEVLCYLMEYQYGVTVLAGKFEVSKSTVVRWAAGKTCPLPVVQKQVMEFIRS